MTERFYADTTGLSLDSSISDVRLDLSKRWRVPSTKITHVVETSTSGRAGSLTIVKFSAKNPFHECKVVFLDKDKVG